VTLLTVVGFSVAVTVAVVVADANSSYQGRRGTLGVLNGHPRTHRRTQPTRTPSTTCTEVVASTLLPVDLHVAPPSPDVGAVAELDYSWGQVEVSVGQ